MKSNGVIRERERERAGAEFGETSDPFPGQINVFIGKEDVKIFDKFQKVDQSLRD